MIIDIEKLVKDHPNNYSLGEAVRALYWADQHSKAVERREKNDSQLRHEQKVFRVVDDAGCDVETGKFLG
jgi:hypothetical protein